MNHATASDPFVAHPSMAIRDLLTKDEIDHVWSLKGDLVRENQKNSYVIYKNRSAIDDPILNRVLSEILLPDERVTFVSFWESKGPFLVHADGPNDQLSMPGRMVVFPMVCDPYGYGSPTVIFKSLWNGPPAKFIRGLPDHVKSHQVEVRDYDVIPGWKERPFDREIHREYLSHIPLDNLCGFEIESVLPWIPGTAIVFDNRRIHAAGNYKTFGVEVKRGITMTTQMSPSLVSPS